MTSSSSSSRASMSLQRVGSSTGIISLALEAEIVECERLLSSGKVPLGNTSSGSDNPYEVTVRPFLEAYEAEFDRISTSIRQGETAIIASAQALLLSVDAMERTVSSSSGVQIDAQGIQTLRDKAASLSDRVLDLNLQTVCNAQELRRIAFIADDRLGTTSATYAESKLSAEPWTNELSGGGMVVVLLSDIYNVIRELEEKLRSSGTSSSPKDSVWVAPTSFERVTTKYWVKDKDLSKVMMASVAELPLLVYGRKGGRILDQKATRRGSDANAMSGANDLWASLASPISSVYFDNADMDMYKERIKRSEGAKLFRIRWYGSKPKGDSVIFLELKTHHEKWIGDKSVKDRCPIREKDVPFLIDTTTGKWSMDQAFAIVRVANPKESEDSLRDLAKLLLDMRNLILKKKLTPCVRTKYNRVALQSSKNNNLRLTIDRNITMINERCEGSGSSWCLEDDESIPIDALVRMPYCVFEVKVSGGETPPFVASLESSHSIVEAKKFSKFLSGASLFNAVQTLPWWADDEAFVPLFKGEPSHATPLKSSKIRDPAAKRRGSFRGSFSGSSMAANHMLSIPSKVTSTADAQTCSLVSFPEDLTDKISEGSSDDEPSSSKKKGRGAFIPGILRRKTKPKALPIASKSPVRVEPKSYFANERTFIQWISAALLFVTISQLLWVIASTSNNPQAHMAGSFMVATALFITAYGLFVYYRRIQLMRTGKPYGYADFAGPGILTFSVLTGISLLIYFSMTADPAKPGVTMTESVGSCVHRQLPGLSVMESQPSGVVVDKTRGLALVPSLNQIIAVPSGLPTSEMSNSEWEIVGELPGTNLEALEIIDNKLYALSEGIDESEILYLEWAEDGLGGRHLEEQQRWKIPTPMAEAMTLIPGEGQGAPPKLIVAGNMINAITAAASATGAEAMKRAGRLTIDVFTLGAFDDGKKAEPIRKLNKYLLSNGLKDEKVGAMQYYEDRLYVLFDNERKIRSFDMITGEIVQEILLPIAAVGSDLEWEGMRLERVSDTSVAGGLRGSESGLTVISEGGNKASDGSTALLLHLALDTPGQIWTIRLDELADGKWKFPRCAGV